MVSEGAPGDRFGAFVAERSRPNHARRSVASHASYFLPMLRAGDRVLDLGCGPGSITVGLSDAVSPNGSAIGVDLNPGPAAVPLVTADAVRLPFEDRSFDAVHLCALLQHVEVPLKVLREAHRVCRGGAAIGIADVDWGSELVYPESAWLRRGREIRERLRAGTSITVGRQLAELLHAAGFVDVIVVATGSGGSGSVHLAQFEAGFFDAPPVVDHVVQRGIATAQEMEEVANAWRQWGAEPGATLSRHWFEAVARAPAWGRFEQRPNRREDLGR